MTYITRPTGRKAMSIPHIMVLVLTGFVLVALHSSTVQAQWATNGNNINNTNTGNVGIGTTTPNAPLEVKKSQNGGTTVRLDNPDASSGGAFSGLAMYQNGVARAQIMSINDGCTGCSGGAKALQIWNWLPGNLVFATNATERVRIDSAGKVGIGTTNPTRMLEVLATDGEAMRLYRNSSSVGWGVNLKFAFNNSSGAEVDYAGLHGITASTTAGVEAGHLVFTTVTGGSLTEKMRVSSTGNVGIGSSAPGFRLDVQGGAVNASGGLCIAGDCKTAWSQVGGGGSSQWTTGGSTIYYNTGFVGIGTSGSPAGKLDVRQISNGGAFATLLTSYGANEDTYLRGGSSAAVLHIGDISATTSKVLLAESGGNVGIGTTSPATKLHVVGDGTITGNLTVTGNIAAKYQDVAEWVESSQLLLAGTVVVLDHTKSNQVIASSQAYDTRVAGVISLQPGITLGEEGEGKVLVATTGRVRIKVNASRGSIQIGDLLVTSDVAGLAMKSQPIDVGGVQIHRPGTLIGKALEPLATGTGEILVLLSLQ